MSSEDGYGKRHKYVMGDEVKIWTVFGHPKGTIVEPVEPVEFPIKYKVQYLYEDNQSFTEIFEESDLTLLKRREAAWKLVCECGGSQSHSYWCPKYN